MIKEFEKRLLSSVILIPIAVFFIVQGSLFFIFFLGVLFLATSYEWIIMSKKNNLLKFLGITFLLFSFYSTFQIREENSFKYFLFIITVCIFTDIGGYVFGKIFKGPKLTKISPNKTYSGVFGSFLLSIISGQIFLNYFGKREIVDSDHLFVFLIILLISLISQIGDLVISFFKRKAKLKDTGKILPGHGGVLDRIDGLVFCYAHNLPFWENMKKRIVILGSTSSIGKSLLNIIKKDKKNFKIELLTANTNYKNLISQAIKFKVKNIIITDADSFKKTKIICRNKKINIFQNFESLKKILPKKVDYVMSAISGIGGLLPTYKIINRTKLIAIANKEAIVCGWPLIKSELEKNKTSFIPVDSEHFSIFSLIENKETSDIEKIYITASGGPFLNLAKNKFKKIKLSDALKHPNWRMGKKITIDSATLMNKVFEVIEAKNIFNIDYDKISILTHPKSYVHTLIKFKNGLSKILVHEPNMKIPIYNSVYFEKDKDLKTNSLDLKNLNNLDLQEVKKDKFPLVRLLNKLPKYSSLFETVLITVNDYLVNKFLEKKIDFQKLIKLIFKISNLKEFQKFKKIQPKNIKEIYNLRDYVHFKLETLGI